MSRRVRAHSPAHLPIIRFLDSARSIQARLELLCTLLQGYDDPDGLQSVRVRELGYEIQRAIEQLAKAERGLRSKSELKKRRAS